VVEALPSSFGDRGRQQRPNWRQAAAVASRPLERAPLMSVPSSDSVQTGLYHRLAIQLGATVITRNTSDFARQGVATMTYWGEAPVTCSRRSVRLSDTTSRPAAIATRTQPTIAKSPVASRIAPSTTGAAAAMK